MRARKSSPAAAAAKAPARAPVTLDDVEAARARLTGAIVDTDCDWSRTLSDILGCKVWLKFENQQFTASFKERGALNRLSTLSPSEKKRGVIAMSAGNHAQGVAYHAHRLAIPATIVMPVNTPTVKVVNTRRHGAEVVLTGETVEEAAAFAHAHGRERGLTFIHPYDDPLVIAGQGTLALEMLGAAPEIDTFVVPIGGGGLISGDSRGRQGLEARHSPDRRAGRALSVDVQRHQRHAACRCAATRWPRASPSRRRGASRKGSCASWSTTSSSSPSRRSSDAVSLLINIEKTVVEGAGAAGLAAVLKEPGRFKGRVLGLVLCGGNIDTRLLASVLARELAREGRLTQLAIDLVDRPGQLAKVANLLGEVGANIVEVYHQRIFSDLPAKAALLELVIETRDRDHLNETVTSLKRAGFEVEVRTNPGGAR